jgi:hypothetical protein
MENSSGKILTTDFTDFTVKSGTKELWHRRKQRKRRRQLEPLVDTNKHLRACLRNRSSRGDEALIAITKRHLPASLSLVASAATRKVGFLRYDLMKPRKIRGLSAGETGQQAATLLTSEPSSERGLKELIVER